MLIQNLINETRILLNDFKYNSNSSHSDQMFTNQTLLGFLNEALFDFDYKTGYQRFDEQDTEFNIVTVIDQDIYDLPSNITKISSIKLEDGGFLNEVNYGERVLCNDNWLMVWNDEMKNRPGYYILDYQYQKLKLYNKPDKVYTLQLRGIIRSDQYTISQLNTELGIAEKRYHSFFRYYIASKCLEIMDQENTSIQMSQYYMSQWNEFCKKVKIEIVRLSNQRVSFDNGNYNA